MLSNSIQFRSVPPKGGFLDFFHEFLRWGHKILHVNSNGRSGRILADWIPFPATDRILNFILLQKFLSFCPFLTIFCLSQNQNQTICHKMLYNDSVGLKEYSDRILAGRISLPAINLILNFGQFWKICNFFKTCNHTNCFRFFVKFTTSFFFFNAKYRLFPNFLGYLRYETRDFLFIMGTYIRRIWVNAEQNIKFL